MNRARIRFLAVSFRKIGVSPGFSGLILSAFLVVGSCGLPKVARVQVSPEQIKQSSQLVREGDQLFSRKEYYPALGKYTEAVKLNPNNEYVHNKIGISLSAMGFFREAEQAVKRSLALNGKYYYAHNNLGTIYFAQGDLGKAVKYFKAAIKMAPTIASFHVNLAQVYLEKNNFPEAIKCYQKAKQLDPTIMDRESNLAIPSPRGKPNPEKSYSLARLYAAEGNVERAVKYLQDALRFGFTHLDWVDSEPDFDSIRDNPEFALFYSEARLKYRAAP
jgi:tetratricopeptide (TPR) repeat protein